MLTYIHFPASDDGITIVLFTNFQNSSVVLPTSTWSLTTMTTTISNFHPFFIPQPPSKFGGEILTENSEFSIFYLEIFLSR